MTAALRFFRCLWRIPAVFGWMLLRAVLLPFSFIGTKKNSPERARAAAIQTRVWAKGLMAILGLQVCVEGSLEKYDRTGGLMISNHQSWLDILVHASVCNLRFTPNLGIRSWPVLGWYVNLSNPVWIDRTTRISAGKALAGFRETLANKTCLMIYPEGTTTDGHGPLLPFKSTAFETVAGTGRTIQPVLTFYTASPGDRPTAWYDATPFAAHVFQVLGNRRTRIRILVLPEIVSGGMTRKETALLAHDRMEEIFLRELSGGIPS